MKRPTSFYLIIFTLIGFFMVLIFYFLSTNEQNINFARILRFQAPIVAEKSNNYKLLQQLIGDSRKCMESKNLTSQERSYVMGKIADMECSKDLFDFLNSTTTIKEILLAGNELKYFILPFDHVDASCNIISLGIGGETDSEERIKKLMPQCKFLGIDNGAEKSQELYERQLGGTYVEGLVGAKNGTFTASVWGKGGLYESKQLQHFAFTYFLSKYFKGDLIDLIFMDIEGDEFELMKDMIDNPDQYPPICQINVEFHQSPGKDSNMLQLYSQLFERSQYVAIRSGFFFSFINKFHLINVQNIECLKKYLVKE